MWRRFIPERAAQAIDLSLLVQETDGFSPADIEYAARQASQRALEKAVYEEDPQGIVDVPKGPVTQEYLDSVAATRTTVRPDVLRDFREDIDGPGRT